MHPTSDMRRHFRAPTVAGNRLQDWAAALGLSSTEITEHLNLRGSKNRAQNWCNGWCLPSRAVRILIEQATGIPVSDWLLEGELRPIVRRTKRVSKPRGPVTRVPLEASGRSPRRRPKPEAVIPTLGTNFGTPTLGTSSLGTKDWGRVRTSWNIDEVQAKLRVERERPVKPVDPPVSELRADFCVVVARALAPTATDIAIEDMGVGLMSLTDRELIELFARVGSRAA